VRFKQIININLCSNTCRSEMPHNPFSVNSFYLRYQHIGISTILPPYSTQQNKTPTAEPVTGLNCNLPAMYNMACQFRERNVTDRCKIIYNKRKLFRVETGIIKPPTERYFSRYVLDTNTNHHI